MPSLPVAFPPLWSTLLGFRMVLEPSSARAEVFAVVGLRSVEGAEKSEGC